jgi:hypothetical protein
MAEDQSSNWSGYVATGSFKAVSGSWTVPTISCPADVTNYSSQWIGIDGDPSPTVEQDGTEADCFSGTPQYDAWYELYAQHGSPVAGGAEDELSPFTYPVAPGDAMSANVSVTGSTWTLAITDTTQAWTFSRNVVWATPLQESAEWIAERPEVGSSLTDLANFGSVSFTGSTATATGASTSRAISAFSSFAPIEMIGSGGDLLAAPGTLSGSGENFTDTWYASS